MQNLPPALYRAEQTREMDRLAIEDFGVSANILMERAGDAVFSLLRSRWPQAVRIAVMCGSGNNAGDGFVIARLARQQELEVTVFQVGDARRLQGDALAAMQRMQGLDLSAIPFETQSLDDFDVVVDALLGTGLSGEVREPYLHAINAINQCGTAVLAVDLPSGLNADSGMPCGVAVEADCSMSFIGLKQGMFCASGPDYCGEVFFDNLSVPLAVYERITPSAQRLGMPEPGAVLKPRQRTAHKGDHGHVLLVGGDTGMLGAVRLAGEAALRAGAGLVSVATRRKHAAHVSAQRPELMSHGIEVAEELKALSAKATVIAIGPGLGQDEWAREMLSIAVARDLPLVVDADALNLLSQIELSRQNWILTPHPGEAARLLHSSAAQIQQDRFSAVTQLAHKFQATVVLKGAGTLVMTPGSVPGICTAGNPGMATAGMGDVLTGVIAALLAQGLTQDDAARFGVCVHAGAADLAVRGIGERGLLAGDLMAPIRRLVNAG